MFFSITKHFFLTVGQNNFGNKIPFLNMYTKTFWVSSENRQPQVDLLSLKVTEVRKLMSPWPQNIHFFGAQLSGLKSFDILGSLALRSFVWKIVLTYCEKNCSSDREKPFENSRLMAEKLQTFCDHLKNLFQQWKVRTIFETQYF